MARLIVWRQEPGHCLSIDIHVTNGDEEKNFINFGKNAEGDVCRLIQCTMATQI
jgi:hypothetical protein